MWNVDGRTKSDDNSSHGLKARWAKKKGGYANPIDIIFSKYPKNFNAIFGLALLMSDYISYIQKLFVLFITQVVRIENENFFRFKSTKILP